MKRQNLIVAIIGSLLFIFTGCQDKQAKAGVADKKQMVEQEQSTNVKQAKKEHETTKILPYGGEIEFEEIEHDFGKVAPKSKHVYGYKFKNVGSKALNITKISKTCGCTVINMKKKVYQPGEKGTLEVKYTAGVSPGPVTRKVYVYSSDEKTSKIKLIIKAQIAIKVEYEPKKIELAFKNGQEPKCPPITLKSIDGKEFAVTSFSATSQAMTLEFDPTEKKTGFTLSPKINGDNLEKGMRGLITLKMSHPEAKYITIPFSVIKEFVVEPASLVIVKATPNEVIKREIWVLNNYGESFEIVSLTSEKKQVKLVEKKKIDGKYKLSLEITIPEAKGKSRFFTDRIAIKTDSGKELSLHCRGFYKSKASKLNNAKK